jgi:ATP-dependent DNA helicase RecG
VTRPSPAGLATPEFEVAGGEVLVRFLPTRYVAPTRVGRDLSPLQRELLEIVAQIGSVSLAQLRSHLASEVPERTIQDNLQLLRSFDLVDATGRGRGARWVLKGVQH